MLPRPSPIPLHPHPAHIPLITINPPPPSSHPSGYLSLSACCSLGTQSGSSMTNGSKQFFQVKRVVIYPRWCNPKQYSYDIGLIQLDRPAILNRYDTLQLHGVLFVKNERYEIINFTFTGLLYLKYAGDGDNSSFPSLNPFRLSSSDER